MSILSENIVQTNSHTYKVILSENFSGLSNFLEKIKDLSSIQIITEKKIFNLYGDDLKNELKKIQVPFHFIFIKGKEKNKHIKNVRKVYNTLIHNGTDRKSLIVAFGGGIVGDFSGFIASTFLRGLRFIQIPTTLLACVDSSVGGKVAVNADLGKNMIGAFHQPELVFAPLNTLNSLKDKEWRCGFAEVIKHSLLDGGDFFNFMKSISKDSIKKIDNIVNYIRESVRFKAHIVSQDPKEQGIRAILNLGHTTGHAIESYLNYKNLSHGEAVGIGLVTALLLSKNKLGFSDGIFNEVISLMNIFDLKKYHQINSESIIEHMLHDKKTVHGKIKFVLLKSPGDYLYGQEVTKEEILEVLNIQKSI